ncbi:hypothetical protein G9A89_015952 [Geosiphon pyriformis]|nr:hypothetical protein G9A89_015952 [Geosiphon pyriformis]
MAYAPIAKLDNFTEKAIIANGWNDARAIQAILYFFKDTTNSWYQSLVNKPQDFNAFKAEFLRYFSNNNSINCLVNTFITIKQGETEAILNQFIRGLHSSILQHVCPLHSGILQDAVTCTRNFESTKSEANHAQAVNLVMNGSSELDSKLEKFTAVTSNISTTATNHLSTPTNSNTTQNPAQMTSGNSRFRVTQNWRSVIVVHQPIPHLLDPPSRSRTQNLDTSRIQNPNSQHYLSLLVTPENATSNNTESNQHIPTNTIPPATISSNESLAAIFPFKLEENTPIPLFSGAALEKKSITAMYTNARVDDCRVDRTVSARIITADRATKTPIGKINEFPFKVNSIVTPIKVLVMEATQYQALVGNNWLFKVNTTLDWNTQELQLTYQGQHIHVLATCGHFKMPPKEKLLIKLEKEKEKPTWEPTKYRGLMKSTTSWKQKEELTWETNDLTWTDNDESKLTSSWGWEEDKENKGKGKKKRPPKPPPLITLTLYHNDLFIINLSLYASIVVRNCHQWAHAVVTMRNTTLQQNSTVIHAYLNTLDDQRGKENGITNLVSLYCDECDLIYNPPPRMIYSIPEEEEPISSYTSESELPINCDSNSDNDDDNNSSSSVQIGNDDENDLDSDSKPDVNYEQYIALPDLSKEQELKWYSDNREGIMPERAHDTDAGFNLRYPRKDAIKLKLHSHTCIDLKIALEIPATTMVQLASRSSLVKRGINIRGGIIDVEYVENIIAMLQNDSEKAYIIEPNEKIAQAIFLPLIRVAQLVSVGKREELGITARGIQGFGSTGRIEVSVNMVEEEIVGQGEIISTGQAISILPYSQYMLAIERKKKKQEQIFEVEATLCELGEIGLINLHIPAKSYSSIKILIYNNTGNVINIPEGITIGYLTTKIKNQPPNPISDFPQLCGYVDITLQTIYG